MGSMNKKLFYNLVIGGVILIGILSFVFKKSNRVSAPVTTITAETVVEKTNEGFSPNSVTIKKGESVKFVNKSTAPMWVASAPHPTHTDYPEFDQKANGDVFTFSFAKVGSWKYHNHSPFSSGGTVIVTD